MHRITPAIVAFALVMPAGVMAQKPLDPQAEIQNLRRDIDAMRQTYEVRLQALEQQLVAAQARAVPPKQDTATSREAPANAFNPAISLSLSGGYTRTSRDPANYQLSGFQLPPDAQGGPGSRGFGLGESELGFSANIDPWWRGAAHIALGPDDSVGVEEAYVQTTALGGGTSLKAGRFFSNVGYLNSQHAHAWDFVDSPLAYQAFMGGQYGDDGVQLSWVLPTERYFEVSAELGRGRSFPGTDTSRNGAGMAALSAHTGGDIGASHSWRAGVSMLRTRATEQALAATDTTGAAVNNTFTGRSRVWLVDGVWKWAPNGNAKHTHFKLQGEYLRSTREGDLTYDIDAANSTDAYRATQSGWYLQGLYQFMPRWQVGLRAERLDAGNPDFGANAPMLGTSGYRPSKNTALIEYKPSEFSRLRLQFSNDRSREDLSDQQIFLFYQMSLGAHGAHAY